ncbi:gamma-glutamylcyclotransferase family protein [Streptomyces sp. NPDC000229]|uniref:gamma-glutamylcyclotransferase family protein n=1 Tax=Streptomyces sp. NPDC000229 TaxID=3154247 RepID=UPI00333499B4
MADIPVGDRPSLALVPFRQLRERGFDVLAGALLYDGPGYPYLVRGAGQVAGDLISAAPGRYEELLAVLDLLEDGYEREVCEVVRTRDGASTRAWVYVATRAVRLGEPIAGGDWLSRRPLREARLPGAPLPGAPRTP